MFENDFRNAIRNAGLQPPGDILPGRLLRFPGVGKNKGNTAGWCKLFDDGAGGVFGDFSTGLYETWQSRSQPLSKAAKADFMRRVHDAREQAENDRRKRNAEACSRAMEIWAAAAPAPSDHPYLRRKQIRPHGARLHKSTLVLPVMDFAGTLTSLQFIAGDGRKMLLSGGRKRGCFIPVAGAAADPSAVLICEGWGTGCTLAEQQPPAALVLAAIDAGNLEPVAVGARCRWPDARLIICGDDDRKTFGNPGRRFATAAAAASGADLAFPAWPDNAPEHLSDFNDLAVWLSGGEA